MRKHRSDAGFSLAALIFFATAASILLAAAVPAYQMQAKRELEEELIFRGEEYARAIQKYQRRFGVYPGSVEQLVSTNGLRFLRRPYADPMTGKEFRIISINPDGSVNGSKIFMRNTATQPLFGDTQTFGQGQGQRQGQGQGLGQGLGQGQTGGQFPGMGQGQNVRQPIQGQPGQQGQPGVTPATGQSAFSSQPGGGQFGAQRMQPNQPGQLGGQQSGGATGFVGPSSGTPIASGGIIGVASDSDKESIKVYNTRQKYDEWEFIAILGQQTQQGRGQQPPNQQGNQPGGPRQNNPIQGMPLNPITGQAPGSPFGTGRGQPPAPNNPFGFGAPPQQPGGFGAPQQPPVQQPRR